MGIDSLDSLDKSFESPADTGKLEIGPDEKKIDRFLDWVMENSYTNPFTLKEAQLEFGNAIDEDFIDGLINEGTLKEGEPKPSDDDEGKKEKTYELIPEAKRVIDRMM